MINLKHALDEIKSLELRISDLISGNSESNQAKKIRLTSAPEV